MWMKIRRPDAEPGESGDRAVRARHADVPHTPAGLFADPHADHLVVPPQGAVEKHEIGAFEPLLQPVVDQRTARDEVKGLGRRGLGKRKTDSVAGLARGRIEPFPFLIERRFAGDGIGPTARPEPISTRRSSGNKARVTYSGESTLKIGFSRRTASTGGAAWIVKRCRSRRCNSPAIASISPPLSTTPAIGDDRSPSRGCSAEFASI